MKAAAVLAFLFLVVALSFFSFAHHVNGTDEHQETCGAPAFWEAHKTMGEVGLEALALATGLVAIALGFAKRDKRLAIAGALFVLAAAGAFALGPPLRVDLISFGNAGSTHEHADFAVFIDGVQQDFSQEKYMTLEGGLPRSGLAHLHDGIGSVMHKHATGVSFAYFLRTLGWPLNSSCITTDANETFCPQVGETDYGGDNLKLFVNGNREKNVMGYSPADGDKVLLVFERYATSNREKQFAAITNLSCVYSGKCPPPKGFTLPAETCSS